MRNRAASRKNRVSFNSNRNESRKAKYLVVAAAAMAFGSNLHHAHATVFTWSGLGTDDNWNTPANWTGTVSPSGTGANLFFTGTVQLTSNNNNTAGTQFATISFQSGAGAFILTGNALTVAASSAPVVSDASTSLETIDIPLTAGSGRVIEASAGTLSIAGGLSGTAGIDFGNSPTQTGQPVANAVVLFNSATNYTTTSASTADTQIFSGTLQIGAGGSLPTTDTAGSANGWVALGSAGNATNSVAASAGFLVLGDANVPVNQTIAFLRVNANSTAGSSVYGGNIATSTLTINDLQSGTDSFSGNLGGSTGNENNLAVAITGGQTVSFSGNDTYNGGTFIESGILQAGSNTALPATGTVTLGDSSGDTAELDLSARTVTLGGLANAATGSQTIGNSSTTGLGTLKYAGSTTPSIYSGSIKNVIGAGTEGTALIVSSGTLSLTGSNNYANGTTLQGGTLIFANGSIGTGFVTLDGGTLEYASGNTQDVSTQTLNFGINGGTVNTNGNNVTFSNPIDVSGGAGGFVKSVQEH